MYAADIVYRYDSRLIVTRNTEGKPAASLLGATPKFFQPKKDREAFAPRSFAKFR